MIIFFLLLGLVLVGSGSFMCYLYYTQLKTCIQNIDGTVIECFERGGSRSGKYYFASVSYSVNGKEYKHRCSSRDDIFQKGDIIPLMYNPLNPKKCYAVQEKNAHLIVGLILIIIGILSTVFMILGYLRAS